MIHEIAPAKVNLFLHVGGKRADGYHELESLVVFADVADELSVEAADALSLAVTGPFAPALEGESDNLVLRAARRFGEFAQVEPKVKITLSKNLPVASGIGGGSSDAAATLRGLSRLFSGRTKLPELWNMAPALGSDVPVCVLPNCWIMSGRGERFASVEDFPQLDAVLVNAGKPVSSAEVYARLENRRGVGNVSRPAGIRTAAALKFYLDGTGNDLEAPARLLCPVVGEQIEALKKSGAIIARMSGSGATCFGIYPDDVSARRGADVIFAEHPNWWVRATALNRARTWSFQ